MLLREEVWSPNTRRNLENSAHLDQEEEEEREGEEDQGEEEHEKEEHE